MCIRHSSVGIHSINTATLHIACTMHNAHNQILVSVTKQDGSAKQNKTSCLQISTRGRIPESPVLAESHEVSAAVRTRNFCAVRMLISTLASLWWGRRRREISRAIGRASERTGGGSGRSSGSDSCGRATGRRAGQGYRTYRPETMSNGSVSRPYSHSLHYSR